MVMSKHTAVKWKTCPMAILWSNLWMFFEMFLTNKLLHLVCSHKTHSLQNRKKDPSVLGEKAGLWIPGQGCESRRQKNSTCTRPSFREIWKVSSLSRSLPLSGKKVSPRPSPRSVFPRPPHTENEPSIAVRGSRLSPPHNGHKRVKMLSFIKDQNILALTVDSFKVQRWAQERDIF
jgi:hypothetical protein